MITDDLSFENNTFKILWYIRKSLKHLDFHYLFIWFGLMIIGIFIRIFSRLSVPVSRNRINRITSISKDEISIIGDKINEKFITAEYNKMKSKVMIDHVKSLRELHIASDRCYIQNNALKCIEIISYCPHLVNVKTIKSGRTPFHKVCHHGHACLVSYMLDKGANPWLTTDAGETALCLAIQACIKDPNRSLTCIELLQKHGCYLDHTDKWYRICLEAALLNNNQLLVRWMFNQASLLGKRSSSFPLARL